MRQILILSSVSVENQNRKHLIYIVFETHSAKNVLLGGIKLYLKLETWFVVDCTLLCLNAGVVNAS